MRTTAPFCGWHRPGAGTTMLEPLCPACGGTLNAIPADEVDAVNAEERDARGGARGAKGDGTTVLALLIVTPWLLALVGLSVADVGFLVPLVLLRSPPSASRSARASARRGGRCC
jgi:hypothetical protein